MSNFINANATYPTWPKGQVGRWTDAEVHSEPTGLAATTEKFSGFYNDIVTNAVLNLLGGGTICRAYLSPHPDFPSLLAYGVKIVRRPGVLNGLLSIEYRGLDPALSYPPPPIYTVEVTTGNEPLATHPLWTSQIAGGPALMGAGGPQNGSQWVSYDKTGANYNPAPSGGNPGTYDPTTAVFYQWLAGSIFTGIEDYLAAGIVYRKRYTTLNLPNDLADVGTFNLPPDGPVPDLPDNYAWFYLGETSEDNAGIYSNSATWKAVPTGPAARIIYGST